MMLQSYLSSSSRPGPIIVHKIRTWWRVIGIRRSRDNGWGRWKSCCIWTTTGCPHLLGNVCSHHPVSCPWPFSHFYINVFLAFGVVFTGRHISNVLGSPNSRDSLSFGFCCISRLYTYLYQIQAFPTVLKAASCLPHVVPCSHPIPFIALPAAWKSPLSV